MDEEAGIYSCLAQRRYSHHNNDADWPSSNLGTLQQRRAQVRGPHPFPAPEWQA
jgi:hypothetical protein